MRMLYESDGSPAPLDSREGGVINSRLLALHVPVSRLRLDVGLAGAVEALELAATRLAGAAVEGAATSGSHAPTTGLVTIARSIRNLTPSRCIARHWSSARLPPVRGWWSAGHSRAVRLLAACRLSCHPSSCASWPRSPRPRGGRHRQRRQPPRRTSPGGRCGGSCCRSGCGRWCQGSWSP